MKNLKKLVYDASVLIEMVYGTEIGKYALELAQSSEHDVYTTDIALAELYYILCRNLGLEEADTKIKELHESECIINLYVSPQEGGRIKCYRAISLADSFVIALAKKIKAAAVFAKKERELQREIDKRPFDIDIIFLEDFVKK